MTSGHLGQPFNRDSAIRRGVISLWLTLCFGTASHLHGQAAGNDRTIAIQHAPPEAYLPGEKLPYFGSQDLWDRRFFKGQGGEDRGGQRLMLDIAEGRARDTADFCEQHIARNPGAMEARFNLVAAYCALGRPADAARAMKAALDAGLPLERFMAGPRRILAPLYETDVFRQALAEKGSILVHGPLLGDVAEGRARFWIRTYGAASFQAVLSRNGDFTDTLESAPARTTVEADCTGVAVVTGLEPDTTYHYNLVIEGKPEPRQPEWQFRTPPAKATGRPVRIAFGGGAGYVPRNERMWDLLAGKQLDAFLFLGDNVYIDVPEEAGPVHDYTYYRRQSRPEFRRLVAGTPIYSIWDDHDCAMDDVFFGPYVDRPAWKPSMWRLFRNNWNNPGYGNPPDRPGCWFQFAVADVDIFMLDCRYYRENFLLERPSMLGPVQKQWLFDALRGSRATFKVIVSSVPWALDAKPYGSDGGPDDTWYGYQDERLEIFDFLTRNRIEGVLLLSADRHRSDVRINRREGAYDLYEFESSKLTNNGTHPHAGETLFSYNDDCSFGLLSFDTTPGDAKARFSVVNIDGQELYALTVRAGDLKANP